MPRYGRRRQPSRFSIQYFRQRLSAIAARYTLEVRHRIRRRILIFLNVLAIIWFAVFVQPSCMECDTDYRTVFPGTKLCGPCSTSEYYIWKGLVLVSILAHFASLRGATTVNYHSLWWCILFLVLFNLLTPLFALNVLLHKLSIATITGSIKMNTFTMATLFYQLLVDLLVGWHIFDLRRMTKTYFPCRIISLRSQPSEEVQDALEIPVAARKGDGIRPAHKVYFTTVKRPTPKVTIVTEAEVHHDPFEPTTNEKPDSAAKPEFV